MQLKPYLLSYLVFLINLKVTKGYYLDSNSSNATTTKVKTCESDIYKQLKQQNIKYMMLEQTFIALLPTPQQMIQLTINSCQASNTVIVSGVQSLSLDLTLNEVEYIGEGSFFEIYDSQFVKIVQFNSTLTKGSMLLLDSNKRLKINNLICSRCSDIFVVNSEIVFIEYMSIDRNQQNTTIAFSDLDYAFISQVDFNQLYGRVSLVSKYINITRLTHQMNPLDKPYRYDFLAPDQTQIILTSTQDLYIGSLESYCIGDYFHIIAVNMMIQRLLLDDKQKAKFSQEQRTFFFLEAMDTIYIDTFIITVEKLEQNTQFLLTAPKQIMVREQFVSKCKVCEIKTDSSEIIIITMHLFSELQINSVIPYRQYSQTQIILNTLLIDNVVSLPDSDIKFEEVTVGLNIVTVDIVKIQNITNLVEKPFKIRVVQLKLFVIESMKLTYHEKHSQAEPLLLLSNVETILLQKIVLDLNYKFNIPIFYFDLIITFMIDQMTISNILGANYHPFSLRSVETFELMELTVQNACFNLGIFSMKDVQRLLLANSSISISKSENCQYHSIPSLSLERRVLKNNLFQIDDQQPSFFIIEPQLRGKSFFRNYSYSFQNVTADFGEINSRMIDTRSINNKMVIDNCVFSNMHISQNGGCLKMQSSSSIDYLLIQNSVLHNCQSENNGGAVYGNNLIFIRNLTISNSSAILGTALFGNYQGTDLRLINNPNLNQENAILNLNKMNVYKILEYNDEITQFPSVIESFEVSDNSTFFLKTGVKYILLIEICYRISDAEQLNNPEDKLPIQCFKSSKDSYKNLYYFINSTLIENEDTEIKESFLSNDIDFLADQTYLVIQPKSNKKYSQISLQFLQKFVLQIPIQQTNCSVGQYQNYINEKQFICQFCPEMSASYESNSSRNCTQCDPKYFSECYGNFSSVKESYYRDELTLSREKIYACSSPQFCIGGSDYGDSQCSEGRVGFECTSCDIHKSYWNQSYSQSGYFSCIKCREVENNQIKIILLLVVVIIFLFLVIHSNTKNIINGITQQYLSKMGMIYLGKSFQKLGQSSVYIKIFSFNASMMYFIQQQLNINWKGLIFDHQMQFSDPLKGSAVSLDCAIKETYPDQRDIGFIKLSIYLSLPLIIFPIALTPSLIMMICKKISKKQFFYTISLSCIYVMFISFYNPILSICLDALLCRQFSNKQKYSFLDLTETCDKASKYKPFALSGVVIYSIIVPIVIFVGLMKNKNNLKKISTLFTFGFLYRDYKQKYFFWEFMRFSVKILILIISKTFFESLYFMNSISIICLLCYLVPLILYRPFAISRMNSLEIISVSLIILSFFALIIFSSENNNSSSFALQSEVMLYLSLVLSILFILYLSIHIILSLLEIQLQKLQKYAFLSKILSRFFVKIENQKILRQNMNKLRKLVKRIIGQEIRYTSILSSQKKTYSQDQNEIATAEEEDQFYSDERNTFIYHSNNLN